MSGLVEFLKARLDEDEAIARRASDGPWRYNPRKQWNSPPVVLGILAPPEEFVAAGPLTDPTCIAATGPANNLESMVDAEHIAQWDPARVLAEVEAKRALLDLLPAAVRRDAQALVLMAMARPYADHPDYDPAWSGGD